MDFKDLKEEIEPKAGFTENVMKQVLNPKPKKINVFMPSMVLLVTVANGTGIYYYAQLIEKQEILQQAIRDFGLSANIF